MNRTHPDSPQQPLARFSVAMTGRLDEELKTHLVRDDGQEDLCMAVYRPSTGATRISASSRRYPPEGCETDVHGNVSFTGDYVLRNLTHVLFELGGGVAILHSHPGAIAWQEMSGPDRDVESSFAFLVSEITGLPLVGMTLATASGTWSARFWNQDFRTGFDASSCENVRVIGDTLRVSWNTSLRPVPVPRLAQVRSMTCWGPRMHADISRLRSSLSDQDQSASTLPSGSPLTGLQSIAILDFDTIKLINLDRIVGASALDVWLRRSKVDVALRLLRQTATSANFEVLGIQGSVCDPDSFRRALDYDLIFCCVDDIPGRGRSSTPSPIPT